jgi:hypothetical protein
MSENQEKTLTATEIRQNWDRFNKLPETIAVNKAIDKVRQAILCPLIKRAEKLLKS